jgi:hypothetical protein
MALPQELVSPISVDLRAEELKLDIVKGIEFLKVIDGKLDSGDAEEGDWVKRTATGFAPPSSSSVAHVYPVITGNNRYDSLATGQVTVAVGGGFIYKTKKFVSGSYAVGDKLCVKDLGGGEMVPSAAGGSDAVVARVFSYDAAKGIMEIEVL